MIVEIEAVLETVAIEETEDLEEEVITVTVIVEIMTDQKDVSIVVNKDTLLRIEIGRAHV